jgi:hypothetical protein
MRKYGLSSSDVAMSHITEDSLDAGTAQLARIDAMICSIVREALGVEVVQRAYRKTKGFIRPNAQIVFVGEACRVEIAKYAFVQLRRQLNKNMKTAFEELLVSAGCAKNSLRLDAKRRDAYAQGWCVMVVKKVKELAPVRPDMLESYLEKIGVKNAPLPMVSKSKTAGSEGLDSISFHMMNKGREDGKLVNLHQGVNTESKQILAIAQA